MSLYKNCTMEIFFPDGTEINEIPCEVSINLESMTVSYRDEGVLVTYTGKQHGEGHFKLEATHTPGRATLHRFPDDDYLEGYWTEHRQFGMWRIILDD